jgi:hypothetical protein
VSERGNDLVGIDDGVLEPDSASGEEALEPQVTEALLDRPFFLTEALRDEVAAEMETRDGQWTAFEAGVSRRIDEASRLETRMSLEDRAIEAFKKNVEAELATVEPRFERSFKDGVERQIWRAAKEPPSLFERMKRRLMPQLAPTWRRAVLATATAAILGLLALRGLDRGPAEAIARMDDVSVNQVSFEGTVTVMPADNGMTVVWLASETSS